MKRGIGGNLKLWSSEVEARVISAARSIDEQTTPEGVKFCKRCVVSNQRPRIVFDDEGVCSACRFTEHKRAVDWASRADELSDLLKKHRSPSGYDVIVPCSGGKDSSMVAHRLKHDYGMHPLCVKWAPFKYTDIGFQNFTRFIDSGFDCLVAWPNGHIHRKLSRLAFEFLGDAWQPFAYGQLNYALHISDKFDVPLVFFGENGEAEYGGDPRANDKPCWDYNDWDDVYLKGAAIDRLVDLGVGLGAFEPDELAYISDFYRLPKKTGKTEFHWFSYYQNWNPQENYYYAAEHTGFQANTIRSEGTYSKYASLDDRFDGFHYYLAYIKFGVGRCTSDAAHEIRDRHILREEAQTLVKKFDGEFPIKHFAEFLEYLGIDEGRFHAVVDSYRPAHIWENGELIHKVWE